MLKHIYISAIFFALHSFLVIYINSPFLGGFFSDSELGIIYIIGAILNIVLLSSLPRIIATLGIHKSTVLFILLEALAILGIIVAREPYAVFAAFTLHQAMILTIFFMFDEYLEYASIQETRTGRIRSFYLTASNIILVISPLVTGALVGSRFGFGSVYFLSFLFLIPLLFVVYRKLDFNDGRRVYEGVRVAIRRSLQDKNSFTIIACRFILECFYAWMVIYMALYLLRTVGFDWATIGPLFTIMLLPFVIFEIPLGVLSDKYLGEKEILVVGFAIIAVSTAYIPFISTTSFFVWAITLFLTRVGASFVEIGTESFFFKHIKGENAGMISLFRTTRPLSYVVTPAIATITFLFLPLGGAFYILAAVVLCGSFLALRLKDTK